MNALKRAALLCALFLAAFGLHAQTAVSGTKVVDNTGALLASGDWCFGATCLTVTNGVFSGTVLAGNNTVTVTDGGSNTYLTVPNVAIGSSAFNWDLYVVPLTASISGMGQPRIACQPGASYTQTDAPVSVNLFTCMAAPKGQAIWVDAHRAPPLPPGSYAGVGSPVFNCTVPCTWQRTDIPQVYILNGNPGDPGSSWVPVTGGGASFPATSNFVVNTTISTSRNATPADLANLLNSLTGCTTPGLVYSPASGQCVTGGSGTLFPSTNNIVVNTSQTTSRNANPTDIASVLSGLSGCSTSGMVYSPASGTCVTNGSATPPGGSNLQLQFNNSGTSFGGSQITTDASTHSNLNVPNAINSATQFYQNRQDIIDAVADAGAQGAGNTTSCVIGNLSGCHDDFAILNSLFNATSTRKHKVFLKPTTTLLNACDYYSSQSLTTAANVEIAGIVGNHFSTAVPGGQLVTICFASGQGGITLGSGSHISGLDLVGNDPWTPSTLSTYVVPARYGGTGPNADGLVLGQMSVAENMNVRQFAGDGIRLDSALTGGSDGTTVRDVFVTLNRGSGIVHASADGQVGIVQNAFSRSNQIYNINDYSQYGNVYLSGNTSGGHSAGIALASWPALNGAFVSDTCNGTTCVVTMSATNTMFAHTYINKYDLSMNDEIEFQGTADPNLNNVAFWIVSSTPTTLTVNCTACASTATAGGTAIYNPGARVWSSLGTDGLRGGGWGIGQPNLLSSAGGASSVFDGPYSEETDHFNEFCDGISAAATVQNPMGLAGIQSCGVQFKAQNVSGELPQVMFVHDIQNPQLSQRHGGYNESFAGPTVITAFNNSPSLGISIGGAQTTYSTEIFGRRSVYGNVSGCWMFGQNGSYSANTVNKAGICLSDALTVWGRTDIDGTEGQAWVPNLYIGNVRGGGQPDMNINTCAGAAPATGTWRQGDLCLNVNFNGTGTWAWQDTTAGFSASPTWTALSFAAGGGGITALTGDVTASGTGSVSATVAAIQGVTISGTPSAGNILTASGPTAAAWTAPGTGGTVTTSGTPTVNCIAKFSGSTVIGNSLLCDNGTIATYSGTGGISTPFLTVTGTQSGTALGLQLAANTGWYSSAGQVFGVFNASVPSFGLSGSGARTISTGGFGFTSGANVNALVVDTDRCRISAGIDAIETAATCTNTIAGATGGTAAAMFEIGGATFTTNAGCTDTALVGGASGGHFQVGTSSACTTVITMGNTATAAHGWVCKAVDLTTPANLVQETATTTTTVTLGGTFSTSDVIWFACDAL